MKKIATFFIVVTVILTSFTFVPTKANERFPTQLLKRSFISPDKLPPERIDVPSSILAKSELTGTTMICPLIVGFSNLVSNQPKSYYEDLLVTGRNSMSACSKANSYGLFEYKSDALFDPVVLPETWEKYFLENEYLDPFFDDLTKMIKNKGLDISSYDNNSDGIPDILFMLLPAITMIDDQKRITYFGHMNFNVHGNFVMFYFGGGIIGSGTIDIATLYMFFNQVVGIPSLFSRTSEDEYIGAWDTQATGYVKGALGMSSYTKHKAGWLDIKEISKPGEYSIDALGGDGPNKAYKIPIPGTDKEYILVENRQKIGSDALLKGIAGEGIVIYHLNENIPYNPLINSTTTERPYPGLQVLDRSQINFKEVQSWDSLEAYYFKPGAIYSIESRRTTIDSSTVVNTLPFGKVKVRETITIYDISKSGPTMTFKLRYDRPTMPIVNVDETLPFAKIEKGKTKTMKLNFRNIGSGNIKVYLKSSVPWITLDRANFIGTDEDIEVTVETKSLKYGMNLGYITYSGTSEGQVKITVDVAPITGDINLDSAVDDIDIDLLRQHLGENKSQITFDRVYDLDKNGEVNGGDLIALAKNYKTRY